MQISCKNDRSISLMLMKPFVQQNNDEEMQVLISFPAICQPQNKEMCLMFALINFL